jgi:hypothetical protein
VPTVIRWGVQQLPFPAVDVDSLDGKDARSKPVRYVRVEHGDGLVVLPAVAGPALQSVSAAAGIIRKELMTDEIF